MTLASAGAGMTPPPPSPPWHPVGFRRGVRLWTAGEGTPVVVFPGLEGTGDSCLHLVLPVVHPAGVAPRGRVLLLDYAAEDHPTLTELVDTACELLAEQLANEASATLWGQSFGNALLALVAQRAALPVGPTALVSPFTRLAAARVRAARALVRLSPAPLYRVTAPSVARVVFGPAGDNAGSPFFAAVARASKRDVLRRVGWLEGLDVSVPFLAIPGPVSAWFGARDRLIDLDRERAFFLALTRGVVGGVSIVPGAGHVILPSAAVAQARRELAAWLAGR